MKTMFYGRQKAEGRKQRTEDRGQKTGAFTLAELLVVMAIFSMICAGILAVFNVGLFSLDIVSAKLDIQQESRRAMFWIVKELRETDNTHIVVSEPSRIQFQLNTGINSWGSIIEYALVSAGTPQQMIRRIDVSDPGQVPIEFKDISNLSFDYSQLAENVVGVTITASKTARSKPLSMILNTGVKLRN